MPSGHRALRSDVTDGIIESVLDELADVGYGRLSMDGVARRAKAGKAALYRRWSSKQEMVLDAVTTISVPALPETSGDLRTDVAALVRGVDEWISDPRMTRVLPDLLAEAVRNTDLADALTARIGVTRRESGRVVIMAAIDRGEVRPDVDIEYALDLVAAPVFWRICGRRLPTTPEFLDRVVGTVLNALPRP
ncbi:TetR-like C-terminal domain-containing protein [Mycolicibacterium parafortuitum]|uniref:TetR-like C-terminal domain-containing protein n=1 Tax=Mycolicibacterium parafortuitum TaxID=39692 RepID=UPI0013D1944F|nr:TetR-like C-terminal domain-containing protein [Mycolicibacterium parafortuitum]